ncbi:hypothetical protein Nepgr_018590 [Nepenthes gracilis]|uniref:Probable Ufm1-specific protease n=1 Tax=Nepenthes gracilis TaxID=150966 RepID=A0AAD3STQ4_NEPGR|nr:hypothetical protein Nepgr_018590 [Nepenthes gracilis]
MDDSCSASVRVLCRKLLLTPKDDDAILQWLIGSPFFPPFTIVSTIRCIHHKTSDHLSPDYSKEAEELRTLIIKGFHICGALIVGENGNPEQIASGAIDAARRLRKCLSDFQESVENLGVFYLIGGVMDSNVGEARFFMSKLGNSNNLEAIDCVVYEDAPEKYVWERGCLLLCELDIKLPVYVPANKKSDAEQIYSLANEELVAKLKDPQLMWILERVQNTLEEVSRPVIIRGAELDFLTDLSNVELLDNSVQKSDAKLLCCSFFCSENKRISSITSTKDANIIKVSVMLNRSENSSKFTAPTVEYYPALEEVHLLVVGYKLDVLCYAAKHLPLTYAVSKLIIPALADQLTTMKNAVLPTLLAKLPQLRPYHFSPAGILPPITVIYECSNGETEIKQVELRRSLHLRLGLPSDRPLLQVVNALNFSKGINTVKSSKNGSLLRDVHTGIPSSGVSGGLVSLIQGSYVYYHYLQEGFDDSGWGCAYRSLQTIISWFRLQHYTSVDVPSHREIQEALVDIGDKDPSFIGSREWIGAIELSFVLDKLLGVTCKVINVRSGAELPEKCRELALHFENQGTPIMIGGGVLAYTLLGVDYNELTGECAFLILDPHYTGGDDLKKIVNGGWCGWKRAVDSKGRSFFLHSKFYNLLLPQRPNMV